MKDLINTKDVRVLYRVLLVSDRGKEIFGTWKVAIKCIQKDYVRNLELCTWVMHELLINHCTTQHLYFRVYDDEEELLRSIFASSAKEDAIQNQYEFFVQRMGGPPLYSQRKGHLALIGLHRPFLVSHQAAERWLHHMQLALDDMTSIDNHLKIKMMNFSGIQRSFLLLEMN